MSEGPEPRREARVVLDLQTLPTRQDGSARSLACERLFRCFSSPQGSLPGTEEALLLLHPRGPCPELSGESGLM